MSSAVAFYIWKGLSLWLGTFSSMANPTKVWPVLSCHTETVHSNLAPNLRKILTLQGLLVSTKYPRAEPCQM